MERLAGGCGGHSWWVHKTLDFCATVGSLDISRLPEMNDKVREPKGQHEASEDGSVDV